MLSDTLRNYQPIGRQTVKGLLLNWISQTKTMPTPTRFQLRRPVSLDPTRRWAIFSGQHPYRERRFLRPGDELNHDDDDGQKDGK